ncbi:MAG TPA: FAD-linked oxidase C-terminal domain-containing protein [Acidimicrobiales bacterium]|nr:FAD-linked oxidase C-terminal domain-containing protein [Acidimicrobiales bacterium]
MNATDSRTELLVVVGADSVTFYPDHNLDDLHDESLHHRYVEPFAVVRPSSTEEVSAIAKIASRHGLAMTARGSGTGLSGGATPVAGGIVISFERMNQVLSVDLNDHVAVVQPGLTLRELGEYLLSSGLRYPVYPGELSGSIGGNVNTNAGGMRAVRHGVTRQNVLGLELVLADGTVLRTGGPVVKSSSGYDLTQLVIGSEGTLALVTEVTLKLSPALAHAATLLVPFASLDAITRAVPTVVASGLQPSMLEYLDVVTLSAVTAATSLELGVEKTVDERALAYLIVVLETRTAEQLDDDVVDLGTMLEAAGALDVYVLPEQAASRLIAARERLFWVSKDAGAKEIVDIVVPRSAVTSFLKEVARIGARHATSITGCGHVGDGNVHLAVFLPDDDERTILMRELFIEGLGLGGQISGEHGIGCDKQQHYLALTDPTVLELERGVKRVFDPQSLLNPFRLFDDRVEEHFFAESLDTE